MIELILATLASLAAGFIDSLVGGGGLILVPALFALYPGAPPATLLGTNKVAAIWGTALAAVQFSRRVDPPWRLLAVAAPAALAGSFAGAWTLSRIDPSFMRQLLPVLLIAVLAYSLANRDLGLNHAPRQPPGRERAIAGVIGALVGWYDGFLGPGTGSFFIFLLVRLLGFDFLHASAVAKILNTATNLAALLLLAAKGQVWWQLGLTLAAANMLGSLLGAALALRHGARLIRGLFLVVVSLLILKTGYDALLQ